MLTEGNTAMIKFSSRYRNRWILTICTTFLSYAHAFNLDRLEFCPLLKDKKGSFSAITRVKVFCLNFLRWPLPPGHL